MDVAIVTTALLLRLTAIAWSLVLLARVRDGWIACVTAIFAIMTVRLAGSVVLGDGTWEIAGPGPLTNLGQLATSALMVAAAGFLDRTLTDRDRAQRALEKTQRELERRV